MSVIRGAFPGLELAGKSMSHGFDSSSSAVAPTPARDAGAVAAVVLAVLAATAAVTWAGPVLKPFLVAIFLYYAAQFGAKTIARLGLGPRAAYLGLLLCALLAAALFGRLVYRETTAFLRNWPKYESRITTLINSLPLIDLPLASHRAVETAKATATPEPAQATSTLGELFRETSKETLDYVFHQGLGIAELFALVTVYLVFLFVGSRRLPDKIRRAFPGDRGARLLSIGVGITDSMERFMAVKTIIGLGMAVSAAVIMLAFGLDHWLLWSFLFFAANYITYIGSLAALVPPILLAFVDLAGPVPAAALAALLIVNRLVWIDFVEVRMSGRQLNLDPTLMFLWLSYWGWVWGVLGLLLAYPMLAAVKIVLEHVRGSEGWATLLSEE